jgi:CHAD domain-containing protein
VERHAGVQHRLRIKCKSLRYSLEMLEWRMGKEATWRIAVLRKAQDVLGDIHDTDVFLEFISSLERLPPAARKKPCRELTASLREERKRHFAAFLGLRAELERAATLHNF